MTKKRKYRKAKKRANSAAQARYGSGFSSLHAKKHAKTLYKRKW